MNIKKPESTTGLPYANRKVYELIQEVTNGNVRAFAKSINVSQQRLNRIFCIDKRSGKYPSISDDIKQGIIDAYDKDEIWFITDKGNTILTGEGEMLKEKQEMPLLSSGKDRAVISYENGVPYYDEDFVLGFNELGFPASENPQFLVQMPKYSNATLWCNATGHSMEPEINSGDVIALKLIEDSSFLLTGDLYAIVTTNGLRTIKRLGKGRDDNHYRLIPTNKDYEEQEIPKKMILKVYKVLGNLHSF